MGSKFGAVVEDDEDNGTLSKFQTPARTAPVFRSPDVIPKQFGQETTTGGTGINPLADQFGALEAIAAITTAASAEPIAGIRGIAAQVIPGGQTGAEAVESTREALSFQPRTAEGQQALTNVAEVIEPVAKVFSEAEKFLGEKTFEATGSPALAAAAQSIPTAITEILGFAAGKGAIRGAKSLDDTNITREISEAAPSIDQLKDASRAVYKEIDELGFTVKPEAFSGLVQRIETATKRRGLNPKITPKAAAALEEFQSKIDTVLSLDDLDQLRTIAQNAASSLEPPEKLLGTLMIDAVDNFLDDAGASVLARPSGSTVNVAERYGVARSLWGRARRSELLQEAFETARNQASGFENGIRVQFRRILNNKRQRKFFNKSELDAIRRVVRGDKKENLAKLIGRFGFSEGGATNIIGGALGVTAGGLAGGIPGAVIVPTIGQISRQLAQRMTARNAQFADEVVRAGNDARKITRAYIRNTPEAQRNPSELSELLLRSDIDLSTLDQIELGRQAAQIAFDRRTSAASAAGAGALAPDEERRN